MEEKCSKRRLPNFSEEEKQVLLYCVKKEASILNNKKTDSTSVYHKKLAWEKIEQDFNSYECVVKRDVHMLKRFWISIKNKVRRESRQSQVERGKSTDGEASFEADGLYDISLPNPPLKVEWANETEIDPLPMADIQQNIGSTDAGLIFMQEINVNDQECPKNLPPSFMSHLKRSGNKKPMDKEQDLISTEATARISALKKCTEHQDAVQELVIQKHKMQILNNEAAERREIELYRLKKRALELEIEERESSLQLTKVRLAREYQ